MLQPEPRRILSQEEISQYVVCPEAWRLKYLAGSQKVFSPQSTQQKQGREAWVEAQELSERLRRYAKISYLLLVAVVIVVFLLEYRRSTKKAPRHKLNPTAESPAETEITKNGQRSLGETD